MRMFDQRCRTWLVCLTLSITFVSTVASAESPLASDDHGEMISFHRDVQPIFRRHCFGCHQGAKQLGAYVMTNFASLTAGGESGQPAITPGKPEHSYLLDQITPIDGHAEMPDEPFAPLSEIEIERVRRWIVQGAQDDSPEQDAVPYGPDHPPSYQAPPAIASVDVSPDGKRIAVAGFHEVVLLDAASGQTEARLIGMSPRINTVRFSPDGKRIVAAGGVPAVQGELQIWSVETGDLILSRLVTYDALCGASWSPDGSKVAFGASDNIVRAIDAATGEQVLFQGAHEDWVRDTAFTPDGKHLISVGRDMSCKLTEVETERFVDNITSITPGALSGGLSSVAAHPDRDEILIGGADGIAKVYRVFRQTARKIGDDANLIRELPKMPGRIFSVAISRDASRLASASTIDGRSEVRVWKYDFDGTVDPTIKKILEKRVNDRTDAENKQLDESRNRPITELARVTIEDAAVYAIAFAPDQSLITAASDAVVRRIGADGKLTQSIQAFEISEGSRGDSITFDAVAWNQIVADRYENSIEEGSPPTVSIKSIEVSPSRIEFGSPYDYTQLIVTAIADDGSTSDITRACEIQVPDWMTLTADGLVRPFRDGVGSVTVGFGNLSHSIDARGVGIRGDGAQQGQVDYIRDVAPVLSRLGCNSGTCHGAQKGKNGFRLSLRGYDPIFDLRALTDDLAARRINAAAPSQSLMLRKPLGTTPHQGGALMTSGDPNHTILSRWIADGSRLNLNSSRVSHIEVFPVNPIVQSVASRQQVRVVAHYDDGSSRDVTREAFIESGNSEVATSNKSGLLASVRRGEAPILARFEGAYAATTLTVMGDRSAYQPSPVQTWSRIDELVAQKWRRVKVQPSKLCDDATFLRRVHLDLTGLPPTSDQVREFLADATPTRQKRKEIIDRLIQTDAYTDYWTNKWSDLLQVNRKFLGVEGSTKFRQWIRNSVAENKPYDQFAREVLTATGSNNDNPPASYYKVLRTPDETMENTTHLFLGIRFNCNKCHDHPFERWTQDQYYQMSAFFAQVDLQRDPASGDRKIGGTAVEGATPLFEKVVDTGSGDIMHPKTNKPVEPTFPFDVPHETDEGAPRREQLAEWITDPDNPYFARSYVNRLWGYLLGVGLIEPIDDIRAGNPPTNPELLDHLTQSFIASDFDVTHMLRMICNSRTYQLSVATNPMNEDDRLNYSHALPRRLPAEVIYDTVHKLTGSTTNIPGVPDGTRAAALPDSGVKLADGFLQNLGRPVRESACECERSSELQLGPVMALISGPTIGTAIADPQNELQRIVDQNPDDRELVDELFLRAISRTPTDSEYAAFNQMVAMIADDHVAMMDELSRSERQWKKRRVELEAIRQRELERTQTKAEQRKIEMQPQRERLEAERVDRIAAAKAGVKAAKTKIDEKVNAWSDQSDSSTHWYPLLAASATATNGASLIPQSDRSIVATGNQDKGTYQVRFRTSLKNITGFRLETIADPSLPSSGPGLGSNGNFVLTELEVKAAAADTPNKTENWKIVGGDADFLQDGFAIDQVFDGRPRDQSGWAVAGATGYVHWATFRLEGAISHQGDTIVTIDLHQFHNAKDHRIGRFRISATTDSTFGLSQPEVFSAILATPKKQRTKESIETLSNYIAATDSEIREANVAFMEAEKPVPPDATLVKLEKRLEELSKPTPDSPAIVQLRDDVKQSSSQLQNLRLTAAEDLTWALINSPAFLFNH